MLMDAGSPGSLHLGEAAASRMVQQMGTVTASPVFSLMVCLNKGAVGPPFDSAAVSGCDSIQWIARDSSKPGEATP
jgi:predicted NAD/FAD-dependent oxidoreductase